MNEQKQFAVVTGASSGIGLELAKQFAKNNFDLMVVAEDEGIFSAASEFEALGANVLSAQINLASRQGVEELYRKIKSTGRTLDAIAINAGVGVGGPFIDNDLDEEINLVNLNVMSTMILAKFIARDMVSVGHGKILFTSSVVSQMPGSFMAVYAASKAFVQSLSEALRNEIKDSGVSVTALMPGATDTNFFERAHMMDTKVAVSEKDSPEQVARQGFEAMMAGKDHVVAGSFMNTVQVTAAKVMSDPAKAQQHRKMAEPGSASSTKKH